MDADERARLRALCEAATPGPWETYRPAAGGLGIAHGDPRTHHGCIARIVAGEPADAALMGIARTALPALLDDSERLDAVTRERDEARAMLRNLLARVHRDGGQHSDAVGLAQATEEADEIIARDFAELARLRAPRPSAIVLRPVDPMTARGLPCACDEWGSGHLDGCPSGDESTDGRDA